MKTLFTLFVFVLFVVAENTPVKFLSQEDNSTIYHSSVVVNNLLFESQDDGSVLLPNAYLGESIQIKSPGFKRITTTAYKNQTIYLEEFHPQALYVSYWAAGSEEYMDNLLKNIRNTSINALVIDIKNEYGYLQFKPKSPLGMELKAYRTRTVKDLQSFIQRLKKEGIYLIARMVVFKDNNIASKFINNAIVDELGLLWVHNREGIAWADPFSKEVQDYNIDLAEEVAKMGFDEIQFDYIRFPVDRDLRFARINNIENRVGAISSFLKNAKRRLSKYNVFISADVFGYACLNIDDAGIGQDLSEIEKYVDIISPMLYPSGYTYLQGLNGSPVGNPKETVFLSLQKAYENRKIDPKKFRPWLQAFKDYSYDKREYKEAEINAQIEGAVEFGASGWMFWNPSSSYDLTYFD